MVASSTTPARKKFSALALAASSSLILATGFWLLIDGPLAGLDHGWRMLAAGLLLVANLIVPPVVSQRRGPSGAGGVRAMARQPYGRRKGDTHVSPLY